MQKLALNIKNTTIKNSALKNSGENPGKIIISQAARDRYSCRGHHTSFSCGFQPALEA
jgi:hypothetical protein